MARNDQPRSYQYWAAISATPNDFVCDAGIYGLTLKAGVWGTATLQKLEPDGSYITVLTAIAADGYSTVQLPAGQYRLLLAGVTNLTGSIELIARGGG